MGGHFDHQRIVGVEHGVARGRDGLDDAAFHFGQFFRRVDVGEAEVIAFADVGHDGHVAVVEGQPFAEDAAAGGLEHGHVDARVHQHAAGALRSAAIAGVDAAVVDVRCRRCRSCRRTAGAAKDVGDEARGGRFAVDAA